MYTTFKYENYFHRFSISYIELINVCYHINQGEYTYIYIGYNINTNTKTYDINRETNKNNQCKIFKKNISCCFIDSIRLLFRFIFFFCIFSKFSIRIHLFCEI